MWGSPRPLAAPAYWASVQAVGVLAAAPTVAVNTGVAGPTIPTVTLIVRQAGTGDRCAYLAAVGMLTAATVPVLTQVCHWGAGKE